MPSFRIQRYKTSVTVAHGAGIVLAQAAVAANVVNGILRGILVQTPAAVDASATMSLQLIDSDGFTIYDSATTWAVNTKNVVVLTNPIPLANIATVQIKYSVAQTATDSVSTAALLVERH